MPSKERMAATFLAGPRRHPDHDHPSEEDHGWNHCARVTPRGKRHLDAGSKVRLWSPFMNGPALLEHAADLVARRRREYGEPVDVFETIAKRWSSVFGTRVSAAQVVIALLDVKLVRLTRNPKHFDSIIDVAGYAAVLREVTRDA